MKLCYIAGPYTSTDYLEVEQNILDAYKAARAAIKLGMFPVVPHANTAHFEVILPEVEPNFWYCGTMELLKRCDAIMLFGNWQGSVGAVVEYQYALKAHKEVFVFETTNSTVKSVGVAGEWKGGRMMNQEHHWPRVAYNKYYGNLILVRISKYWGWRWWRLNWYINIGPFVVYGGWREGR